MKKLIVISLLMLLPVMARADVNMTFWNFSDPETTPPTDYTPVYTKSGDLASAAGGYIATFWWGQAGQPLMAVGASTFMDAPDNVFGLGGSSSWAGLFVWDTCVSLNAGTADNRISSQGSLVVLPNTAYNFEVRLWKYQDGPLTEAVVQALTYAQIENAWNLVDGSSTVEHGVLQGSLVSNAGGGVLVTTNTEWTASSVTLDVVPNPNVPEPSTYAALAGLAMLAYGAARRRRK